MKNIIILLFFLFSALIVAQKPCDYSLNFTDSLGTYKSTKDYLIHERNIGVASYIFLSLINANGTPYLKLQTIQKSSDLIKVNCLDTNSTITFQLTNGKTVMLQYADTENCGTMIRLEPEDKYSRVNSGNFIFPRGSLEDLKTAAVSIMIVKYGIDAIEYVLVKELKSDLNTESYFPENYFLNYLNCVE